jgi:viologen exporter family transport system permease protein
MRLYWEVARRGFRRYATYLGATLAGIFTNTVFGFIRAYILIALFAVRPVLGGYGISDALTYTFVTQGLIATVAIWGWFEIEERIRTGAVATDLLRPLSFLGYWLATDYGRACYQALARGIPPFVVAALAFDLRLPREVATWPVFLISVVLAVTVSFGIRAIVNLFSFWFMDSRGLGAIVSPAWIVLSGMMLPLAVFPAGLRTFARMTPFAATFDAPAQVFLEQLSARDVAATLALQALWAGVMLAAAARVMDHGTRKLVIQGG